MLSEERMTHIVHTMLTAIWKADMVDFPNEEESRREAKRVALQFTNQLQHITEQAQKKIRSQKNAPVEHSPQWETLYKKYVEEDLKKRGG